jgi:BirA family biotin operon repressor/biotin-[acetyl-CoA-carboxylase] ligase
VPTAQSLTGVGARDVDREDLLVEAVTAVTGLVDRWDAAGGDAHAAGLADEVAAACTTLGRTVRVELPGDARVEGAATGLAPDGALLVRGTQGQVRAVRAGDVRHLRSAGGASTG